MDFKSKDCSKPGFFHLCLSVGKPLLCFGIYYFSDGIAPGVKKGRLRSGPPGDLVPVSKLARALALALDGMFNQNPTTV
jgi:hypothetical protein